jgi:membrane-associated HD superfamily phosphohydrolase
MRARLLLCLLFIAATPSVASATDYTGLLALGSLALVAVPWAILNLLLALVFAFMRRYSSRSFALKHSCIASAGPVLGMLLALPESAANSPHYTLQSMYSILAIEAGLLVLGWLPMLVHRFQRTDAPPAHAT